MKTVVWIGSERKEIADVSYTVLARRYRSRDFDELVGQEPVARTLQNAIATNRIAHAYLFCGTRGVGKTSMARIFAKAINATEGLAQRDAIADAILRGEDLDVIEIDGASNRGVNEARELIAGAGLSPSRCPYKVYIIDEVHALTKDAFNTLLKTMEEPPAHVKFILCTTEPHKVPATIQSRCQRFNFRPLSTTRIAAQLEHVLKEEGVETSEDVIMQIARLGNGSMRDALSILDRLLATGENPLTLQTVQDTLGLPDRTHVIQLVEAIVQGDAAAALRSGDAFIKTGASIEQVLEMLAEHFRDLMVIATCSPDSDLLEHSAGALPQLIQQAGHFDAPALVHIIAMCDHVGRSSRGSFTARAMFDALLVRLALSEHLAEVASLLGDSEQRGNRDATSSTRGKKKLQSPSDSGLVTSSQGIPTQVPDESRTESRLEVTRHSMQSQQNSPNASRAGEDGNATGKKSNEAATFLTEIKGQEPVSQESQDVSERQANAQHTSESPRDGVWQRFCNAELERASRRRVEMYRLVDEGQSVIHLGLSEKGQQSPTVCQTPSYIEQLAREIEQVTGQRMRLIVDSGSCSVGNESPPDDTSQQVVRNEPLVKEAIDLFDAVITSVTTDQSVPPPSATTRN